MHLHGTPGAGDQNAERIGTPAQHLTIDDLDGLAGVASEADVGWEFGGEMGSQNITPAKSMGWLSCLVRLQWAHEMTRFSGQLEPPRESGTTWST